MTQEKIVNLTGNDITIVGNYRQIVAMIPRSKNPATIHLERARRPPAQAGGGIARSKPRTLSPRGRYLIDR